MQRAVVGVLTMCRCVWWVFALHDRDGCPFLLDAAFNWADSAKKSHASACMLALLGRCRPSIAEAARVVPFSALFFSVAAKSMHLLSVVEFLFTSLYEISARAFC